MRLPAIGLAAMLAVISAFAAVIETGQLPALDHPVSNNAVTLVATADGDYLFSFLGLGRGKTWQDITSDAFVLEPGKDHWKALAPVPGPAGRLAASAVSVAGAAWLFGGYTVAVDGSEASTTGVYRIRPGESQLQRLTDMPIAVEDSVALAYQDRFIYLVSGWHDLGNVNLVQVLDTVTMQWTQATPWPGAAVFGHSGGISGAQMLVCDGVRIQYPEDDQPRQFLMSDQCWLGSIDIENHRRINWRPVPAHPGAARYRMAATGDPENRVVFAGGSTNPYNFNGIGYNGDPADGETGVFSYDLSSGQWQCHGDLLQNTMDHRGLPNSDGWYYLAGGMHAPQLPVAVVLRFRPNAASTCRK